MITAVGWYWEHYELVIIVRQQSKRLLIFVYYMCAVCNANIEVTDIFKLYLSSPIQMVLEPSGNKAFYIVESKMTP